MVSPASDPADAFPPLQYLEEEPRTNRLEYSLELWNLVCFNPLLKNAQLVLVLNKVRNVSSSPSVC